MYATGWHGGSKTDEPAGYGLKFVERDRDKYFDREWTEVLVLLEGGAEVKIALSPSFWRTCSELRSADIGKWLIEHDAAPWASGHPPGVIVTPVEGNQFSARIHKRSQLPMAR